MWRTQKKRKNYEIYKSLHLNCAVKKKTHVLEKKYQLISFSNILFKCTFKRVIENMPESFRIQFKKKHKKNHGENISFFITPFMYIVECKKRNMNMNMNMNLSRILIPRSITVFWLCQLNTFGLLWSFKWTRKQIGLAVI